MVEATKIGAFVCVHGRSNTGKLADMWPRVGRSSTGGLFSRQKSFGAETTKSEELLASYERSQAMFEDDLARQEHE